MFDFQVFPDKSIEPPPEPLPLRYNLDNIWGSAPDSGTTRTFANAPQGAPDDATRLASLLRSVPYYVGIGKSAAFPALLTTPDVDRTAATKITPANYDGTFLPSSSMRTVTPPNAALELASVVLYDPDIPRPAPLVSENNLGLTDEQGNPLVVG